MHSRSVFIPSTGEASMASLIFGFIASMATILVILMVLLNSYLQPYSPTAVQQQPAPVIGRNAASDHQTGQLPATPKSTDPKSTDPKSTDPKSTDVSPSSEAARTLATDVEVAKPESTPAPAEDSDNVLPVTAEAAPTIPDNKEIPIAAPAEAKDIKRQKSASHHRASRHHEKRYQAEEPYGYGSFSRDDGRF
jgi:hypothetical protein